MEFLCLIIGIGIGLIPFFFKKQKIKEKNKILEQEEKNLRNKIESTKALFLAEKERLMAYRQSNEEEYAQEKEKFEKDIQTLRESYLIQKDNLEKNFENRLIQIGKDFQQEEEKAKQEYLKVLEDYKTKTQEQITKINEQAAEKNRLLESLKIKVDVATEAAKREEEKRTAVDFYRLQLSAADCEEVKKLREIISTLRDQDAINKVIWKVYYEKPTTDLIGRVVGSKIKTGIYKITNIQNQMTYVGQSVNIAERWKQHIKRGLGAETPTRNKLYPAMAATGLENFTFELIEECDKSELDEREKYWQNYFNSLSYGYSMR